MCRLCGIVPNSFLLPACRLSTGAQANTLCTLQPVQNQHGGSGSPADRSPPSGLPILYLQQPGPIQLPPRRGRPCLLRQEWSRFLVKISDFGNGTSKFCPIPSLFGMIRLKLVSPKWSWDHHKCVYASFGWLTNAGPQDPLSNKDVRSGLTE